MAHKINVSVASLQPSQFEGWATKQGGSWKSWKRRWFVIKDKKMWYFSGKNDTEAKGWIDLTPGTEVKDKTEPGQKKKFSFAINSRGVKGEREFLIFVESETDLKGFLKAINQVLSSDKKSAGAAASSVPKVNNVIPPSQPVSQVQAPPPLTQPYVPEQTLEAQPPIPQVPVDIPQPPVVSTAPVASPVVAQKSCALNYPNNISKRTASDGINIAKDMSQWLKNNQPEGIKDFLNIWKDSLPVSTDIIAGEFATITLCVSADTHKMSWRVNGPQSGMIQKMVDFFWNVGAPENEIDRLNDLGAEINPNVIGSWIDMSQDGGMDGGWFFPVDIALGTAKSAGDVGEGKEGNNSALDVFVKWAEQHGINMVISVGRDMGATPPRQTDFKFKIVGPNQVKLSIVKEAGDAFGFPKIPQTLEDIILGLDNSITEISLSVVTSTDGFVKFGVIIPTPTVYAVADMLQIVPEADLAKHQFYLNSFGQPSAIEYAYLNKGFGFEVYKEGVDVHVYYTLGDVSA
ncbi:hypothetical protein EIN_082970 [Entamoeba invadens IP1]|uniref:PH domain-containing protein n=1 Tax=Entamoeba invadens TaxID=33085 RepID=S0B087_ENTIV|nr:hypothetical protein EIN_082970 [Entamoeba invadens IP1]ELP85185.1 hypothetical protein EIN_082970 [Entamoeba invadens IP1]BAN40938.1 hypothetical protein [Entamoeba invadens]BAN42005.1 hypothetical protein [Entamoeba invadens]|eukprot:XP_004184531.1 hypothetical protein EIN_082970 [Entamoeba invadens IP1]